MNSVANSTWTEAPLGELLSLRSGKSLPKEFKKSDFGPYPFYGANGEIGRSPQPLVKNKIITIGRVGACGEIHQTEGPAWIGDNALIATPVEGIDFRFLFYLLRVIDFSAVIGGSTQPLITQKGIKSIKAQVPTSETEQRRIAWALGSLDDKIELNKQMARTLEDIVAAIFRARFIDFEGVEEFEDSELGPIPKGWRLDPLDAIADFVNGGAFTKGASGTGRPVIRIRELNGGITPDTPRSNREVPDAQIARDFDLLFSWSGSLDVYRWSGEESLINQHIFKVIPKSSYPSWLAEMATKQHLPEFQAIAASKATTMGHIQRKHLTQTFVAVPPAQALEAFDRVFEPVMRLRGNLMKEVRNLTVSRDELLPRLVSGQVRVPERFGLDTDAMEVAGELAEA